MMVIPTTIVEVWLSWSKWGKAREDLKTAKNKGGDIVVAFQSDFKSVEDFEEKYNVKLSQNIASMLTNEPPKSAITPKN